MASSSSPLDLREAIRERLLKEMLGGAREDSDTDYMVLIMDSVTTKIFSAVCQMSDLDEPGVSLVEDLKKKRQPMPDMAAVYFISPFESSITRLIEDCTQKKPMYDTSFVYFSSKVPPALLNKVVTNKMVVSRLAGMKEVNLEFAVNDAISFVTHQPMALKDLFQEGCEGSQAYGEAVHAIASRLATFFTSVRHQPAIRYKEGHEPKDGDLPGQGSRNLVCRRIAFSLYDKLRDLASQGTVPKQETCDLLLIDRAVDPLTPLIHEWSYESLVYDLLDIEGNVYKYMVDTEGGKKEEKRMVLGDSDSYWAELRFCHIAETSIKLNNHMNEFQEKNKTAQIKRQVGGPLAEKGDMDARTIKNLVASLPQYREQLSRLSLHIEMASQINTVIRDECLDEMGKLEQELAFGDASGKDLIALLTQHEDRFQDLDKLRLLCLYHCIYQEKFDSTRKTQWMKLMGLAPEDMHTVGNLEYLGVPMVKRSDVSRATQQLVRRKPKDDEEDQYALSRFKPLILELGQQLAKGQLPKDQYVSVAEEDPPEDETAKKAEEKAESAFAIRAMGSVRTYRSARSVGWARRAAGTFPGADLINAKQQDDGPRGKPMVIFIVGGIVRAEIRAAKLLSKILKRDVIIGGTSMETPRTFCDKLHGLCPLDTEDVIGI